MLISRTPLRISLGGGGTDLPSYYREGGGFVLSAAIDKYVFVGVNSTFSADYLLKYSLSERVDRRSDVQHPILREALELLDVGPGIEVVSMADIPAGTGLGSSGSFTVGLLRSLFALQRQHISTSELAQLACHIEIDRLGESIGKQDQHIAAYGGLTCFDFLEDGSVAATPLALSLHTLSDLESNLMLFFTGYSRAASGVLQDQNHRSLDGEPSMRRNLDETKELGLTIRSVLEDGNPRAFGELLNEHWQRKRSRSPGMSNPVIDSLYELGLKNGAVGGKLVGAGAGGFLLFYADHPDRLRAVFRENAIQEVPFRFDHDGSVILARS